MHPDSGKAGGFFNKVMHLVRGQPRNPDAVSGETESLSAHAVLQESMVRKRRNEMIRRHEFAQLRLLRQRNEVGGQPQQVQPSKDGRLSSLLGYETRSHETLQKIDAIEAQMSGQWWRNPAQITAKGEKPLAPRPPSSRQLQDVPVLGEESVVEHMVSPQPALAPVEHELPAPVQVSLTPPPNVFQPHPDVEEAAILFAHGDVEGARTRLLEQLVQVLSTESIDENKAAVLWHAVLDVCRATGDEESFEPLAIDYAEHFGRSAPLWISIPKNLGMQALYGAAQKTPRKCQFQWSSPSMLTVGAVTALRVAQEEAPQPWSMSWSRLTSIDEAAAEPLSQLFLVWAQSPGQFVLSDAVKLLQVLQVHTQVGNRDCNMQWWELRLALLRLMNRMDEYEDVALNYCLTYEVSPPAWVEPVCYSVVQEEGEADVSILQEVTLQSAHVAAVGAGGAGGGEPVQTPQGLYGVLEGDPQDLLDALTAQAKRGQVLEVHCDNLIRLDFVAAGSVLNWAAEMQSQGHNVRFTRLHHLVAVFFHVIGIHEHASVQVASA